MLITRIEVDAALLRMFPVLGHLLAIITQIDLVDDPGDKFGRIFPGMRIYHREFCLRECIW